MTSYTLTLIFAILVPYVMLSYIGCRIDNYKIIKIYQASLSFLLALVYVFVGISFYRTLRTIYESTFRLIRFRALFIIVLQVMNELNIAILHTINATTCSWYFAAQLQSARDNSIFLPLTISWQAFSEDFVPTIAYLTSLMFAFKRGLKSQIILIDEST